MSLDSVRPTRTDKTTVMDLLKSAPTSWPLAFLAAALWFSADVSAVLQGFAEVLRAWGGQLEVDADAAVRVLDGIDARLTALEDAAQ